METTKNDFFTKRVLPIMNRIRDEMVDKCADELEAKQKSWTFIAAGAAGPDGGMASRDNQTDSLRVLGKWNSKNVEDYVEAVKKELRKQNIRVTPDLEKKMVDKMVKDRIPKSSIDYVIRKASQHTIFGLQNTLNTSPMEEKLQAEAERRYNPSKTERIAGWALGTAVDVAATGAGGGWPGAAKFVATDAAVNAAVPLIIDPDKKDDYLKDQDARKSKGQKASKSVKKDDGKAVEENPDTSNTQDQQSSQQSEKSDQEDVNEQNTFGWDKLFQSFGTDGLSDVLKHPGTMLAMLPDVIFGLFTGNTKSINFGDCAMPLASIAAGLFVRNPLLKMLLMGLGGANLMNKAGHEVLAKQESKYSDSNLHDDSKDNLPKDLSQGTTVFKRYNNEPLNPRIQQPQLQGNYLLATIDGVPCSISLPERVIEANLRGALPLNTLANAVLNRNDQMKEIASEHYDNERQISESRQQSSVLRQR